MKQLGGIKCGTLVHAASFTSDSRQTNVHGLRITWKWKLQSDYAVPYNTTSLACELPARLLRLTWVHCNRDSAWGGQPYEQDSGPGKQTHTIVGRPSISRAWGFIAGWCSIRKIEPRQLEEGEKCYAYDTVPSLNCVPQGSTTWLVGPIVRLPQCTDVYCTGISGPSHTVVSTRELYYQIVDPFFCTRVQLKVNGADPTTTPTTRRLGLQLEKNTHAS